MKPRYPDSLRKEIIAFIDAGNSRKDAAKKFRVSLGFVFILLQQFAKGEHLLKPKRKGRFPGFGKLPPYSSFLITAVERDPHITMEKLARLLATEHGVTAAPSSLSYFLRQRGFAYESEGAGGKRTRKQSL
jgi:transposase